MILFNPTKEKIEFRHGGILYILDSKESKTVPDLAGKHAIERAKVPLVEYSAMYDKQVLKTDMDYDTMPWKKIISLASARKLFKPGDHFTKESLLAKLREYDSNTKAGALQESSNQEEGEGSTGPAIL